MLVVTPDGTRSRGRARFVSGHADPVDVMVHVIPPCGGQTTSAALGWLARGSMLELRPTCENCNVDLPPASTEARICSFECTFCRCCVEDVLRNVCPNCGGGFVPRPVRPANNWKGGNYLGEYPANRQLKHRPVDRDVHAPFSATIGRIPPHER